MQCSLWCVCVTQSSLLGEGRSHLSKQRRTWNTRDCCDSLKPTALFSSMGHVISSVKPIPQTAAVRLPTRHPLVYGCELPSSRRTCLSISSVNDLFIIPWRTELTFSFCFQVCVAFAVVRRVFRGLVVAFRGVLSGGDIPREAIMVHDDCDHPCWGEQLWKQLWLINRSLLEWSRWRAHNKQGFTAPPHSLSVSQIGFLRISNSTIQVCDFEHGIWSLFSAAQRTNRNPPEKFSGYRPVEKTNVLLSLNNPQPHSEQLLLFRPAYFPPAQPLPVLS